MSRKIKVLQLQNFYNVSTSDLAEQIVRSLDPARYEVVSAYLSRKPQEGQKLSEASRSVYFEFSDAELKGLRLKALWRLYQFCRQERFEVVICHRFKSLSIMLMINLVLRTPLGIGVTHSMGEFDRFYRRAQIRLLGRRGWYFVGVSPAVRQGLLEYRRCFNEHSTFSITNAIDIEQAVALQLPRDQARQELGLPSDVVMLGALGRLVPVKGHRYLIEAFARLKDKYPDVQLAIIGEGRARTDLQAQVERLGLAGRVHLVGRRPDATQYVRAFDIWVMPSLAEGLGLALLEGMSGRLPVIASDVPAMRPLIEGAGGIAVPPADVEALTVALDGYLSKTDAERRALGQQTFDYLCREHAIEDYREAYRRLIEQGLAVKCR